MKRSKIRETQLHEDKWGKTMDKRKCQCGFENKSYARFCGKCGADLNEQKQKRK